MADSTPKSYSADPTLWLYTSLSSGSSHIVTATSRLETILKANKIPFRALDVATDEKARMLWGRRAKSRKLPGLVRMGMVLADLDEVEEWNEYGEIQENLGSTSTPAAAVSAPTPSTSNTPSKPPTAPPQPVAKGSDPPLSSTAPSFPENKLLAEQIPQTLPPGSVETPFSVAMRGIGFEAAEKAKAAKSKSAKATSTTALPPSPDSKSSVLKGEGADLAKLDNSGPTGTPLSSGTASAEDAVNPETAGATFESKADEVPSTSEHEKAEEDRIDTHEPVPGAIAATAEDNKSKVNEDTDTKVSWATESGALAPLELTDPNAGTEVPHMAVDPPQTSTSTEAKEHSKSEHAEESKEANEDVNPAKAIESSETTGHPAATAPAGENKPAEENDPAEENKPVGENKLVEENKPTQAADPDPALGQAENYASKGVAGEPASSLVVPLDNVYMQHRGSSISLASKEEIKRIEDSARIEEDPNEDEAETLPSGTPISTEEGQKIKEDEEVVHEDSPKDKVAEAKENKGSHLSPESAQTEAASQEKPNDGHIKFVGETEGDERDRVKATLRRNSPDGRGRAPSIIAEPTAENAQKEEALRDSDATKKAAEAEADAAAGAVAASKAADDSAKLPESQTQAQEVTGDPTKASDSVAN